MGQLWTRLWERVGEAEAPPWLGSSSQAAWAGVLEVPQQERQAVWCGHGDIALSPPFHLSEGKGCIRLGRWGGGSL